MKTLKGLLLAGTVLASVPAFSQSFAETALLFGRTQPGGSARVQAMGGAQTSLGGDFSSAYSNPAGLGMYNRSEVVFTPGFMTTSVDGDYLAGTNPISSGNYDTRTNLNLSSLGFVFSSDQRAKNKFIRGTFAVTLNRTNNFNRNIQYAGTNPSTSLIDYFLEQASGSNPNQFDKGGDLFNTVSELAYNNYLIGESTILDPNNNPEDYFTDILSLPYQTETIQTKGAQNQWSFSYGANFDDRFFLGGGLGISSLRYQSQKSYHEEFKNEPLSSFDLTEDLTIRGSAINLTVGGIARPVDLVQVGFSVTTPTYYNLTDNYVARMSSSWNNYDYYGDGSEILKNEHAETDVVTSEYTLATPWRLNVGATFFIKKYGFITADIEQINYARANYNSQVSGVDFRADNDKIKSLYKPTTNIRVGGEFRMENWRLRGGYQLMPDPFNKQQNGISRAMSGITGGFGYKTKEYSIDLAVVHQTGKNSYRPYTINFEESPLLTYAQKSTTVLITLGFSF